MIMCSVVAGECMAPVQMDTYYDDMYTCLNAGYKESLDKSIEIDPNNPYTFNSRGVAFKELKNYESALIDYNKAIKIDPNYGMAYGNRGNLKSMLDLPFCNDYKKACELGQKIVCEWYEDDCK